MSAKVINTSTICKIYRISVVFAEFATLKSPKKDTPKKNPFYTSSLRVNEIAKIGLSENLTHLPSIIFAKICRRQKFPIYGNSLNATLEIKQSQIYMHFKLINVFV